MPMWTMVGVTIGVLLLGPLLGLYAYYIARMATLGHLRAKQRYKELEQEERKSIG